MVRISTHKFHDLQKEGQGCSKDLNLELETVLQLYVTITCCYVVIKTIMITTGSRSG